MAMAMRVAGNKEGNGNGNKGVGQRTAMATKRAMGTATRVAGKEEGKGGMGDGNLNKGGR
jgi:hypothetical protein